MTPEILFALLDRRRARRPTVLATRLSDGAQWLLPDGDASPALLQAAADALRRGQSAKADVEGESVFLDVHVPPPRLLIVGAVHIAQSLAPLAASLGIEPTVVDPRTSFASADRFPGIALRHEWPDKAFEALEPDAATAIVTLSHDPKLDDPALMAALASEAYYVGALGSSRSHAARLIRLRELGAVEDDLARIRGPAGLPIGSVTTAEIALSILGEIVAVRRSGRAALRSS